MWWQAGRDCVATEAVVLFSVQAAECKTNSLMFSELTVVCLVDRVLCFARLRLCDARRFDVIRHCAPFIADLLAAVVEGYIWNVPAHFRAPDRFRLIVVTNRDESESIRSSRRERNTHARYYRQQRGRNEAQR